ncbi:MAG: hypothetical protein JSR26_10510 [Proteobacteria bacterium]|nr:hypothetical protein [Pseudomonadota bacterium]
MGKFARSWQMVKASADVLRSDKELLVFPLVSAVATLIVGVSFFLPMWGSGAFAHAQQHQPLPAPYYIWMCLFYVAQYTVIFFCNTALVGAALIRLDGGTPTLADGFAIARRKIVPILGYALIAATVGMILRALEQRAGLFGKFVIGLIGAAWTVATAMVVPVLVEEDVGPLDAIRESVELLRRNWGENLIGNGGIGIVFGIITAVVLLGGFGLSIALVNAHVTTLAIALGIATVIALLVVGLVQSALTGIYSAALYRYASTGEVPDGYDQNAFQEAFRVKE